MLRVVFVRVDFFRVAFFRVDFLRVAFLRVDFFRVVFVRVDFFRVVFVRVDFFRVASVRVDFFRVVFVRVDFFRVVFVRVELCVANGPLLVGLGRHKHNFLDAHTCYIPSRSRLAIQPRPLCCEPFLVEQVTKQECSLCLRRRQL